ncbi:hypothetical protein EZS27_009372 [termite gut metagenome]|uniref:Uncharacterized protein n=1 Tax=termite gut metagenome TaxID=433724 RepID=A0A5J4SAY9_9ZZZZ
MKKLIVIAIKFLHIESLILKLAWIVMLHTIQYKIDKLRKSKYNLPPLISLSYVITIQKNVLLTLFQ